MLYAIKEPASGWENISEQISFPLNPLHGSVFTVPSTIILLENFIF